MRNVIYLALLLASPAAAQPVTSPAACEVTIARAPDDVRAVVESWVRSEAACSISLELRIVPTDGGLYLLAEDEQGRVRERIVPDAQTAGVLVASWIADDRGPVATPAAEPGPPAVAAAPRPASVPAAPLAESETLSPPGLAPIMIARTAARPTPQGRWLSVGGLVPMRSDGGLGVRGELDVYRRGRWIIGAAASIADNEMMLQSSSGYGNLVATDIKAIGFVARVSSFGRWHVRPAVGAGVIYSEGLAQDASMFYPLDGTFPTLEASLVISRELGAHWAAYAGPLATLIDEQFESQPAAALYPTTVSRSLLDLSLFAGVGRRL
jgi:hypothetical protein